MCRNKNENYCYDCGALIHGPVLMTYRRMRCMSCGAEYTLNQLHAENEIGRKIIDKGGTQ